MNLYDFYENNGLHRGFNNHGMNCLNRGIDLPDPALGIGFAEVHHSVPVLVAFEPIMRMPDPSPVKSWEDAQVKTKGDALDVSSFPDAGYYGSAIGGF